MSQRIGMQRPLRWHIGKAAAVGAMERPVMINIPGYDGILAMVAYWLWWHTGYGSIMAMVAYWLWWYSGYGGILAMVFEDLGR